MLANIMRRCTFLLTRRTGADALLISPSLYVKSSSLRIAPLSTAILGQTGGGGTGITVKIIHSGQELSSTVTPICIWKEAILAIPSTR
jgi:hypothetical protein